MSIHVSTAGKLILSGEHAVVYDNPALAVPVNHAVKASVHSCASPVIQLEWPNSRSKDIKITSLPLLMNDIDQRYTHYLNKKININAVLNGAHELCFYTAAIATQRCKAFNHHSGIVISLSSTVPMGVGMGSSAATIVSILTAICQYFNQHLSKRETFTLARQVEHLQHGHSSGLDIYTVLQDDLVLYQQQSGISKQLHPNHALFIVNTGQPQQQSGECVNHAKHYFRDPQLLAEFNTVTLAMTSALEQSQAEPVKQAIKANHRLLTHIGVVPAKICQFIKTIEQQQGAAKISGAGSVTGSQAGCVIAMADSAFLEQLCRAYHFELSYLTLK